MDNKVKHIVTSCLIIIFILGFSVFAWLKPADEFSLWERRRLAQLPEINMSTILSGNFTRNFESYTTDQFPLRDELRKVKAWVGVNVFKRGENNGIYVTDGYAAQLEYPVDEKSVEYASQRLNYVYNKYLSDNGVKPYIAVIPHKGQFTSAEKGYPNADYDKIVSILKENTPSFNYIDISPKLSLSDYYRTDTHWRQEEITDVALLLGEKMGADVTAEYREEVVENDFDGVYSGQYALPLQSDKICYLTNPQLEACRAFDYENNKEICIYDIEKAKGKDPYEMFLSGPLSLVTIENDNAPGKELVIFRDSFGSAIAPLMVAGYSKITLVDIRYIHPDLIGKYVDFRNCDVLFLYSTSVLNNSTTLK